MHRSIIETPLGPMAIMAEGGALVTASFDATEAPSPTSSAAASRFVAWFAGELDALDALACAAPGTPFQQRVWAALREIPRGTTLTYAELSDRLGDRLAIRAVARANGANPIAIAVPCHRVIGSDGKLVGYAGGLERKRWLLAHEGAPGFLVP
ncbi:MAG: methylated-DNA--[protein]-cysteine S-methyltransferase [Myxococcales bacterium]|nr:methylated-DNA--[protein]-cysteine S-methyltransferase [Myxococcales bacterium]